MQLKRVLMAALLPLAVIALTLPFFFPLSSIYEILTSPADFFRTYIISIVAVLVSIGLIFLINPILPYRNCKYVFDTNGLAISKGSRTKSYLWTDFDNFFIHTLKGDGLRKIDKEIGFGVFYLKTKKRFLGFVKNFVVLYTTPEITDKAESLLKQFIPQQTEGPFVDSGLTHFEFK